MVVQFAFRVEWGLRAPLILRRYRMVSSKVNSIAANSSEALETITETEPKSSRLYSLVDRRT